MKTPFYSGPKISITPNGIKIKKKNLFLPYGEISTITIKKSHITRGWMVMLLLGIILDITLLYLLYHFMVNMYDLSDLRGGHFHYPRRSSGIMMGVLLVLPIIVSYRLLRYFTRPLMIIIKWDGGEFRMKFVDLHRSVAELKRYLEGKVNVEAEVGGLRSAI